jgi:glycosyltransferase involved in cell wall biosynthesis
VVALRHADNRGVGAAIATGYRRALADDVDVVAVMNGDGQMDPSYLDRILDPVVEGETDYAKGTRRSRPADREQMSRWRLFGNALLTLLTRAASGYWRLTDPQNGYTAISRAALESIDLGDAHDRFGFCNDVLVRLHVNGMRVADVPTPAVYGDEESHISYGTFVPELSSLLLQGFFRRLGQEYLRERVHPLALLYPLGALGLLAGVVLLVAVPLASTPGAAASPLALAGGLALLVAAVALDRRTDTHLEAHR